MSDTQIGKISMYHVNHWERFEALGGEKLYKRDQIIFRQGDTPDSLYYIKKGKVKVYISSYDGAEKTVELHPARNLFGEVGFFDGGPRPSTARTVEPSEIITIPRQTLQEMLTRYPDMAIDLLEYMGKTVRLYCNQLNNLLFLQTDVRIALTLFKHAVLEDGVYVVRNTHEEISRIVAVSRVTVSRVLNQFAQNGWIKLCYRYIEVLDLERLKEFAYLDEWRG